MRRRLLNLLTVLSLLLCVAIVTVVARSYWVAESLHWHRVQPERLAWRSSIVRLDLAWGLFCVEYQFAVSTYDQEKYAAHVATVLPAAVEFYRFRVPAQAPSKRWGSVWERLGFSGYRSSISYPSSGTMVTPNGESFTPVSRIVDSGEYSLPVWPLALFALLPPTSWSIRAWGGLRRGRRARAGRCPACGYDVCATPDRCPECGATGLTIPT